jgi:hypothetical protein
MPYVDKEKERANSRRYYLENRAEIIAYQKAWALKNPTARRSYEKKYARNNPESKMLRSAKARAKEKNLEFSIMRADIVIPVNCPVFGFLLEPGETIHGRGGGRPNSPSLDRIDNSKGYVPGNVRVISHMANMLKGACDAKQLRQFAEWILSTQERA